MLEVQLYALAFLVSAVTAGASITTEGRCNFNVLDMKFRHADTQEGFDLFDNATVRKITARQHYFAEIPVPLIGNANRKALIWLLHQNVSPSAVYITVC